VAGGGAGPGGFAFPFQFGGRSIQQGVSVDRAAEIGGDAYLIGGAGTIEGAIGGDLVAGMGRLVISAQVGGDAELSAEELRIEEGAGIAGTLTYSTPDRLAEAGEVAPDVVYEEAQREEEATNIVADLFR